MLPVETKPEQVAAAPAPKDDLAGWAGVIQEQGAKHRAQKVQEASFEGDLHPPDVTKVLVRLSPRFVVERSDPHNWTLMERRRVESGEHQGRYTWKALGYHGTPGQAARKAIQLGMIHDLGPGEHSLEAVVEKLHELEKGVRPEVEKTLREEGLSKALEVVKDEGDQERIRVLLGLKKRKGV